jgi:hypothetical protein
MRSESYEDPVIASGLVQSVPRRFVLVTGAGRSGTSTVAGALNYLGLHVPRPVLATNKSNPRGFFESFWAIQFHRRIMEQANIDTVDARPEAVEKIRQVLRPEHQQEVEEWLAGESERAPQVVVKDPRSAWMPGLWASAAAGVGLQPGFLTMLRHPAEVVGSRATYYAKGDAEAVRNYQVTNIARWVNANLITERQTRGRPRVFLRYFDLIEDWRNAMSLVGEGLELTYNSDLRADTSHSVDDFIDAGLRRHQVTWDELAMPHELQALAEDTWRACSVLADKHGQNDEAEAELDELGARYADLFRDATAIARDVAAASANAARKKAVRETRAKVRRRMARQQPVETSSRGGLENLRSRVRRAASAARRRIDDR